MKNKFQDKKDIFWFKNFFSKIQKECNYFFREF